MVNVAVFNIPDVFAEFGRVRVCLRDGMMTVWFLYLVLKSFSVSPMYVSEVLLLLRVTVAW